MPQDPTTFDRAAAVTRSLLGWGVVAGPFYVVIGLVLALTRPGFDLASHALSMLTLGDHGWMQRANLVVSALMVLAAAYGVLRVIRSGRGLAVGTLTGVYGLCLVLSAIFLPDPTAGFPPGRADDTVTTSGILHLVFGAIGFVCLAVAAFAYARWASSRSETGQSRVGIWCGIVVIVGFVGGAALAQSAIGVALLWLSVLAGWLWLALACAHLYTVVPHPVIAQRATPQEHA
ncbi:DUF998 domain-containing protein [Solicola gregarius]|uniref:DUF998 domain-containing protein n=1 Tax=Solicola gregarius TaxID=2908642 RepID=A0AA46YNE2_9ACTN|nr:DUF998 domain-containing protein [Solicola gregarius]UYM06628.1 DUF998 domain-containing protein [Solicola gregarius]